PAINDFVEWYCSEPRLAFNRTVVLRYRIHLEQRGYAPNTINRRMAAMRRVAYEACESGLVGHTIRDAKGYDEGSSHPWNSYRQCAITLAQLREAGNTSRDKKKYRSLNFR